MTADVPPRIPSVPAPVARVPLSDQVRNFVLEGLLEGRWQPGDRIVERRIGLELGVSQTPIREALRDLQAMQLVESIPNKGMRVKELTPGQLSEVYPVRAALERLAAELAVHRMGGDVTVLAHHLGRLRELAEANDVEGQIHHGVEFHREIVRAAGNQVLLRNWESLAIELWTRLSLKWLRTEPHENACDHEAIVDAFRRQDPYVGRLVQLHVLNYANPAASTTSAAPHGQK
ncbi:GntR family transcriptional regulator [Streptomyces formicae]|uniref:Transcriptional regulator, GntR family n=1 Tax=Streptomyces formicae TaxID=1616117 RepID=A0A291Q2K1_9ACTN|nr:GntR family transcriptional regulator [Streptomyces formicae]ATL25949.1 Transcriptional regulator, GntR family [Streptomyces formicae]